MFEIGSSLREARIRQGLDFEELEARTKVRAKYLRAPRGRAVRPASRATRTRRASSASTRTRSGSTGGSTSTSTTPATSPGTRAEAALRACRARRRASRRRRRERRESRTVGVALAAILLVTALVIAAWRFGGPDDPQVEGINATPPSVAATSDATADAAAGDALDTRGARPVVHGGPRGHRRRASRSTPARSSAGSSSGSRGRSLYLSVDRPANVVVKLNGRRVVLPRGCALKVTRATDRVRVSRPRAAIVVTGSELVRGERTDRNGPFYAREALGARARARSGSRSSGDDPDELEATLRAARAAADVCLVSGGLGPTHDDRTVELVARVAGARAAGRRRARAPHRGGLAHGRRAARPARTPTSRRASRSRRRFPRARS